MAAAMAAAVATVLTVAPPTQAAVAAAVSAAAPAAVPQTPVLEAVQAAAKSLAVHPSMIIIIAWKIITGPIFLHTLKKIDQIFVQVPLRVLQGEGCPCKSTHVLRLSFINLLNARTLKSTLSSSFLELC